MNASNAFRSHLMQQFASAAKSQSRPPLAMMPWMGEDKKKKSKKRTEEARAMASRGLSSAAWSHSTAAAASSASPSTSSQASIKSRSRVTPAAAASSALSSVALSSVVEDADDNDDQQSVARVEQQQQCDENDDASDQLGEDDDRVLASQFHNLIQTRRTTSHFAPTSSIQALQQQPSSEAFWRDALDRAVECGRRAPNHKRTEAFSFKRMLSPSAATERLAEVAYNVSLNKTHSEVNAEKKRTKWSQIPAFLVATLQSRQGDTDDSDIQYANSMDDSIIMYDPIPFVPLQTERELEDYASTCAAVQNVLLSLHAERIASKWATGPVINTMAFRELVGASHPGDRIVALIMIGLPKQAFLSEENAASAPTTATTRQRRFRREWGDYMQDV